MGLREALLRTAQAAPAPAAAEHLAELLRLLVLPEAAQLADLILEPGESVWVGADDVRGFLHVLGSPEA
eukprot:4518353-Alexandrium_andersonii.AAC.1